MKYCVTVLLCDCAIQPVTELFHPGFNCVTYLCVHPASNPDVKYGRIAGTRNEWQNEKWVAKKEVFFPLYWLHPPTCWVRNFIHNLYLVDINLLFPRKSCSIGYRYPLESIDSVRKLNLVIFAHCPLIILPFYPIIILPFYPIICAPTIAHKQSHTMCFAAPTFFFNASK